MLLLFFLALAPVASYVLVPLDTLKGHETSYKVSKSSKVYIVSNASPALLQTWKISTNTGAQNADAYTLSVPQTDGSLTPFVPNTDKDYMDISCSDSVTSVPGYLYIEDATSNLNVFPLTTNSSVSFKLGTNVFFRMESPNSMIPIARDVVINKNVAFSGFVGLPGSADLVKFFDSALIDETNYQQLDLPMEVFHFTSNGVDVQYKVQFGTHLEMNVGQSGLVMTDAFPGGEAVNITYELTNPNNANISVLLIPVLNKKQPYTVNVTLFSTDLLLETFPIFSQSDSSINVVEPVHKLRIENGGPWAMQFSLRDTTPTTPAPVQTTTKSSQIHQFFVSLLVAAALFSL